MPQPKSFLSQFFGPLGWLALGAASIAVIFALMASYGQRTAARLEQEGADATATVLEKRQHRDDDGSFSYVIVYTFTVGAETIEDHQGVSSELYHRVDEGDALPIRYWTGDPTLSEVESGSAAVLGLVGLIGLVPFSLAALVLGVMAWRRASHATWMARNGVRRVVTVTGHREANVEINDVPQWRAIWREPDGREGATRMAPRHDLPEEGTEITILVDPGHRQDSVWERDVLA